MCWDIRLRYGIMLGTCHGVVLERDASLWAEKPDMFKQCMEQALELLGPVREFEFALDCAGNDDKTPLDVYHEVAMITDNEFVPLVLQVFWEAYEGEQRRAWVRRRVSPAPQPQKGYVYLLKGGGYYKIGLSNDVNRRMEEISPRLPFETELICTIATRDMYKLEAALHDLYAARRANGEWFELDEADVVLFKEFADE